MMPEYPAPHSRPNVNTQGCGRDLPPRSLDSDWLARMRCPPSFCMPLESPLDVLADQEFPCPLDARSPNTFLQVVGCSR